MSKFKWFKEMIAWAEGRRVQYRKPSKHPDGTPLYSWMEVGDYHAWARKIEDIEYRIYDFEIGGFYKITFTSAEREPVVAVYSEDRNFHWCSPTGSHLNVAYDSPLINPARPEDRVL